MTTKPGHNINFSCSWCDRAYCVDCSMAETSRRFCSSECEQDYAEDQNDSAATRRLDGMSRARDMQMSGRLA
jgi:hypothetical protein